MLSRYQSGYETLLYYIFKKKNDIKVSLVSEVYSIKVLLYFNKKVMNNKSL